MNKEELFDVMGNIDPESIKEAGSYKKPKRTMWKKFIAVAACAVVIFGAVWGVPALRKNNPEGSVSVPATGVTAVKAEYPKPVGEGMSPQAFMESDALMDWGDSYDQQAAASMALMSEMTDGYSALMKQLLASKDENTVCSPLNIYIALSMLAEISEGNTRKQILDMLQVKDMGSLRENMSSLWKSNYVDTPILKSILANSLWLNGKVKYNEDTLKQLATSYYASSFRGTPGSKEMDEALREWTDENTGGLLSDYTKDMSIKPDTVLELLSTIYYKAIWFDKFEEAATKKETFHGTLGDTTVDMMHRSDITSVYKSDKFTALGLGLVESGQMYFFLPKEGEDVNNLLSDPDVMNTLCVSCGNDRLVTRADVNMSIPKFKVSGKTDLMNALNNLGIRDALDPSKADFSPLTTDRQNLFLSKADHAAMLEIDEEGVTGAAYTELAVAEGAAISNEKIDFVLDRPFMFVVTGKDRSILFSGIVRNIE